MTGNPDRLAAAIERLAAVLEADALERREGQARIRRLLDGIDDGPTRVGETEPIRSVRRG